MLLGLSRLLALFPDAKHISSHVLLLCQRQRSYPMFVCDVVVGILIHERCHQRRLWRGRTDGVVEWCSATGIYWIHVYAIHAEKLSQLLFALMLNSKV